MSQPILRSQTARRAATAALATLLLLTPVSAAYVGLGAAPMETGTLASISAAIGSPADDSEFERNAVIQFTDASTNSACPITSWKWTFGDGSSSTLQNPTHAYATLGSFVVALQVRSSSCTTLVSTTSIDLSIVTNAPTVTLDGPASAVAGESLTYTATGADADGTVVGYVFAVDGVESPQQASDSITTSFTQSGQRTISVRAVDDLGSSSAPAALVVEVAADVLASVVVNAPATAIVNSTHTITADGLDQYGNDVPLTVDSFSHTFQSTVGTEQVCHTDQGITGCANVEVISAELSRIEVTGPASMVVNTTETFTITGYDIHDNVVPTDNTSVSFTAPTATGVYDVCGAEGEFSDCTNVSAIADEAVTITVSGLTQVAANSTTTYTLSAVDQHGNAAQLTETSLSYQAPTTVGPVDVCYTESTTTSAPLTGCLAVQVVAGALHHIVVSGVDSMVANTTETFALAGFDEFENAVALAQSEVNHTASTTVGTNNVCYTENTVQGCKTVDVVADALATIAVTGADTLVAGTTSEYALAGQDQYGNDVALAATNLTVTAPTQVGPYNVTYTESEITGTKTITVVSGDLAFIVVEGPATLVVNETGTYALRGTDQYGNAVTLSQATLSYTAPLTAGPADVCFTEDNVTGCQTIEVQPDALFVITVTGPDSVIAGSTTTFALAGADEHGNAVTLANSTLDYLAPTATGAANVCYTESNVSGCKLVDVTVDALAAIVVSGPDSLNMGESAIFYHAGFDQYGNAVDLATIVQTFTASTVAGPTDVCHTESGVTGCKTITVLPGPVAAITVTGPAEMLYGTTATFSVSGVDAYGNAVTLATSSFQFTAPSAVGPTEACYTENNVTGCTPVEVLPHPLATITIVGPQFVVAGDTQTYTLVGRDQFGAIVPLAQQTLDFTAPGAFGTSAPFCYTEADVQGCRTAFVVPLRIDVSGPVTKLNIGRTAQHSAVALDINGVAVPTTFTWKATRGTVTQDGLFTATTAGNGGPSVTIGNVTGSKPISIVATLTVTSGTQSTFAFGSPVTGNVTVRYVDGTPVASANVQLTFANAFLDPWGRLTMDVTTDANGVATFQAPAPFTLPGTYRVSAYATRGGNAGVGQFTYTVA